MTRKYLQILVGLVTVLSLVFSMAVPSPVFAAEPPPPQSGDNDLGDQPKVSVPEIVEDLPAETELVVTSAGTPQPLATALAAEALMMANNVRFCPVGQPITGACSDFTSIEQVVAYVQSLPVGSGTIYVDQSYATVTPGAMITIDENSFVGGLAAEVMMGLVGGIIDWTSGEVGGKTSLAQPLTILNFGDGVDPAEYTGGFSLLNFLISEGALDNGITVANSQNIYMESVEVDESGAGQGIQFSNTINSVVFDVQVFEAGDGNGLSVQGGSSNVSANAVQVIEEDAGNGVYADNVNDLYLEDVYVEAYGSGDGIGIYNNVGQILMDGVTAWSEGGYGAVLAFNGVMPENPAIVEAVGLLPAPITIVNSEFSENFLDGLNITYTTGDIYIDEVSANYNGGDGIYINYTDGNVELGDSFWDWRDGFGMPGAVALPGVVTNGNMDDGVSVQNTFYNVFIDETVAQDNFDTGAVIGIDFFDMSIPALAPVRPEAMFEDGDPMVTVVNSLFTRNGAECAEAGEAEGMRPDFCGGMGLMIMNSFMFLPTGLDINAGPYLTGATDVYLENVESFDNAFSGLLIVDMGGIYGTPPEADVLPVTGVSEMYIGDSFFTRNGAAGMIVFNPYGDLTVQGVIANQNSFMLCPYFMFDGTCPSNLFMAYNVYVDDSEFNENGGWGWMFDYEEGFFQEEHGNGLSIVAEGEVVLSNLAANDNYENGLNVGFFNMPASADVYLTGGVFNNNGVHPGEEIYGPTAGVSIQTTGLIDVAGVEANGNQYFGGFFSSWMDGAPAFAAADTPPPAVSLMDSVFNGNTDTGVYATAHGDVLFDGVEANENGYLGGTVGGYNVTILNSVFSYNGQSGLDVYSFGPDDAMAVIDGPVGGVVTLENVTANHNGSYGASVYSAGDVFITDSEFSFNMGDSTGGLGVFADGAVSLNGVTANNNAGDGTQLEGYRVKVSNSTFNRNGLWGLDLGAEGSAALINVTACYNVLGPYIFTGPWINPAEVDECLRGEDGIRDAEGLLEESWHIVKIYTDVNVGSGLHGDKYGIIYLYLRKSDGQPEFELARVTAGPGAVPAGTTGTFKGMAQGDLPAGFEGTFGGTAFEFTLMGPDGTPIQSVPGGLSVRFTVEPGKDWVILWYDAVNKKWVELATTVAGAYASASITQTGLFMVVAR